VDLQRLALFVVLEDERNYGRAAARLGITQPALTRHIHALERQLGTALFVRTRPLQLTPAGAVALRHAQVLLSLAERAEADIRASGTDSPNSLRWGVPPTGSPAPVLAIIRRVHQHWTQLRSVITPMTYSECLRSVIAGITDIGILTNAAALNSELLGVMIDRDHLVLATADDHKYSDRVGVTRADLTDQPWIAPAPGTAPPEIHAFLEPLLAGRAPTIVESSLPASLDLVAAGVGVTVLAGHAAERQTVPGVIYLPLADAPSIDLGLFWRRDLQFAGSVISPVLALLPPPETSLES
jgi:DNA-binding transcriptional LysR family regulator